MPSRWNASYVNFSAKLSQTSRQIGLIRTVEKSYAGKRRISKGRLQLLVASLADNGRVE